MPISMSNSARYVTQSSIWSNPTLGNLTDRKIAKYQKSGRIGTTDFIRQTDKIKRRVKMTAKQSVKKTMKLFQGF